jgi:glutamyl-Q tRNA(Asp) synthetase
MSNKVTPYIGRFAPSPTGPLHMGSLIAAVASYLDARANGGQWHLRVEDIDETRCKPEYAAIQIATLHAFGFRWDGEICFQSQRKARYETVLATLQQSGHVFACRCSRKEISDSVVSAQRGLDGPIYPGTCREAQLEFIGHACRLLTDHTEISVDDRCQGRQSQVLARDIGDFIVKRRDGLFAYQLAVVVDDHDLGVTHIVRGADLLDSTPRQIFLQQKLGFTTPSYLHIPIVTNALGQKLSKQTLAPSLSTNMAANHLRVCLGFLGQPVEGYQTLTNPSQMLEIAIQRWQPAAVPAKIALKLDELDMSSPN